jgi:predicted anti-sigma-YlaC factor YlaD
MSTHEVTAPKAMTDCRRVAPQLPELPDGDLPPDEAEAVRAHLAVCAACRAEAEAYHRLGTLLAEEPEPRAVLPSGRQVATWVLEREAARSRAWSAWLPAALAPAALAVALVVALVVALLLPRYGASERDPTGSPATPATVFADDAPVALVLVDDERTGRQVVLAPAVTGGPAVAVP